MRKKIDSYTINLTH